MKERKGRLNDNVISVEEKVINLQNELIDLRYDLEAQMEDDMTIEGTLYDLISTLQINLGTLSTQVERIDDTIDKLRDFYTG